MNPEPDPDLNSLLKAFFRAFWAPLLRAAGAQGDLQARFEDVTVTRIPELRGDSVLVFEPPVVPAPEGLYLEFADSPPNRKTRRNWAEKRFGLERQLGFPVTPLVLLVKPPADGGDLLVTTVLGAFTDVWGYSTLDLPALREEMVTGEHPHLAALFLLTEAHPTEATLVQAQALVSRAPVTGDEQKLLIGTAVAVALRFFSVQSVMSVFGEQASMLKENPLIQGWILEKEREGEDRGHAQGRLVEARRALTRLGGKRFGEPSAEVVKSIEQEATLDVLESWLDRVVEVESWAELFG
jgi:hypothetical protein